MKDCDASPTKMDHRLHLALPVLMLLGAAAALSVAPANGDPGVARLPTPRVQVAVQGADDVEHYVSRQVGMGYFAAAADARREVTPERVADVEVWLTPNDASRYRAWVGLGPASFSVHCEPDQCRTPYDLGRRVASEVVSRQGDGGPLGIARRY